MSVDAPARRPSPAAPARGTVRRLRWVPWVAPLLLALVLLLDGPLVLLLTDAFRGPEGFGLDSFRTIASSGAYRAVLADTLRIALLATLLVVAVGWPLAHWMSMATRQARSLATLLLVLPMLISVVVRAYSWLLLLGRDGIVNDALLRLGIVGSPLQLLYSDGAVVAGTAHILLPLFVLPLAAAMSRIDRRLLTAAETLGAPPLRRLTWVYLPLTLPATLAAATTVFILALGFYVTPAILGGGRVTLVSNLLVVVIDRLGDWSLAAAIAVVVGLVTVVGVLVVRRLTGVAALETVSYATDPGGAAEPPHGPVAAILRAYAIVALFLLNLPVLLIVPLSFSDGTALSLPPPGWSLRWYQRLLDEPVWAEAARTSLLVALGASTLALVLGGAAAYGVARHVTRGEGLLRLQFLAPLLIPEVIIAVAMYLSWARLGLLGNPVGLMVAHSVMVVPLVVTILVPAIRSVDESVERAAWTLGVPRTRAVLSVVLPSIRPALLASWGFAFITSVDLVLVSLFLGGRMRLLPLQMLQDLGQQVNPTVAAIATILVTITAGTVAAGILATRASRGRASG